MKKLGNFQFLSNLLTMIVDMNGFLLAVSMGQQQQHIDTNFGKNFLLDIFG